VPATAAHKTNLLEWVASINTQTHQLGLQNDTRSASITSGEYEIPMQKNDITGWLKAAQFGTALQPELIFFLSGEWGSVTDSESEFSYFARFDVLERYLDERLKALLSDEDIADEWEEVAIELEELVPVAEKMIELENQARAEELLDPKISASKDRILWENNVDQPDWITLEEPDEIGIYPAETRYTFEEVMQTLFIFTMERYQEKGFPEMHFVLLEKDGNTINNSAETAALLTSPVKFALLADMVDGRFRMLDSEDPIDNILNQNYYDILDLLELEAEETL